MTVKLSPTDSAAAPSDTNRDTTLQALRNLVGPAGDKMGDAVRKPVLGTLLDLLGHTEESTRLAAAGCLGALCRWLPADELHVAYRDNILGQF